MQKSKKKKKLIARKRENEAEKERVIKQEKCVGVRKGVIALQVVLCVEKGWLERRRGLTYRRKRKCVGKRVLWGMGLSEGKRGCSEGNEMEVRGQKEKQLVSAMKIYGRMRT